MLSPNGNPDVQIKECFVKINKLDMGGYDSDSSDSDDLPALPYSMRPSSSKPKSVMTTADLLREQYDLLQNIKDDSVSENNIKETLKRLEKMEVQEAEEMAPMSPAPVLHEEEEFNIFCVNDSLQFFNSRDVTPIGCGYKNRTVDFFTPVLTTFENEMLSFKRAEFDVVLSSFLFTADALCISDCKSFITYLLRNLSVHQEDASDVGNAGCVNACYEVIVSLLKKHPQAKDLTFSCAEIFMLLFNHGCDINSFTFLQKWTDVKKSLLVPESQSKNVVKIPSNWIINYKYMLKAVGHLMSVCKFKAADLGKIIFSLLFISLDSNLFKENLFSEVRECCHIGIEQVEEQQWSTILYEITETLLSVEFPSVQEKWNYICYMTESVPNRSQRGIQLRRHISLSALKCLCQEDNLEGDEHCLKDNLNMIHTFLRKLPEIDSLLLSYATMFVDISVTNLDATNEDYEGLCHVLKQCEALFNEKAHEAKTRFMKIFAKLNSYSGGSFVFKVSSHKSLPQIKKEVCDDEEEEASVEDEPKSFSLANVKMEVNQDYESGVGHAYNSENSRNSFKSVSTLDESENSNTSCIDENKVSLLGKLKREPMDANDMQITSTCQDKLLPSSSSNKESSVKIILKRKKSSEGNSIDDPEIENPLKQEFECELVENDGTNKKINVEHFVSQAISGLKDMSAEFPVLNNVYESLKDVTQNTLSMCFGTGNVGSYLESDSKKSSSCVSSEYNFEKDLLGCISEVKSIAPHESEPEIVALAEIPSAIKKRAMTSRKFSPAKSVLGKDKTIIDEDIVIVQEVASPKKEKCSPKPADRNKEPDVVFVKAVESPNKGNNYSPPKTPVKSEDSKAWIDDEVLLINESNIKIVRSMIGASTTGADPRFAGSQDISILNVAVKNEADSYVASSNENNSGSIEECFDSKSNIILQSANVKEEPLVSKCETSLLSESINENKDSVSSQCNNVLNTVLESVNASTNEHEDLKDVVLRRSRRNSHMEKLGAEKVTAVENMPVSESLGVFNSSSSSCNQISEEASGLRGEVQSNKNFNVGENTGDLIDRSQSPASYSVASNGQNRVADDNVDEMCIDGQHNQVLKESLIHQDASHNIQSDENMCHDVGDNSVNEPELEKKSRRKNSAAFDKKTHSRKQIKPSKKKLDSDFLMSRINPNRNKSNTTDKCNTVNTTDKCDLVDVDVANVLKDLVNSSVALSESIPQSNLTSSNTELSAASTPRNKEFLISHTGSSHAVSEKSVAEIVNSEIKNQNSLPVRAKESETVQGVVSLTEMQKNGKLGLFTVQNVKTSSQISCLSNSNENNAVGRELPTKVQVDLLLQESLAEKAAKKRKLTNAGAKNSSQLSCSGSMQLSSTATGPVEKLLKRKNLEPAGPSIKTPRRHTSGMYQNENQIDAMNINKPHKSPKNFLPVKSALSAKYTSNKSPKRFFDYIQTKQKYTCLKKTKSPPKLAKTALSVRNVLKEKVIPSPKSSEREICLSDSDSDVMELYVDPKRYKDKDCMVIFEKEEIVILDSD